MGSLKITLFVIGFVSALAAYGAYKVGFDWIRPGAIAEDGLFARHDAVFMDRCGKARITSIVHDPAGSYHWPRCRAVMQHYGTYDAFNLRHNGVAGLGVLSALSLLGFAHLAMAGMSAPKVVRGPVRLTGRKAYAAIGRISKKEIGQTGAGIDFPPGLPMSRDRESRHCLISGSEGSGKTQTIQHMILEATRWGDKMLILDIKGDMTERLPGEITLIAPQDKRSAVWDISADCVTKQDARELAARFIPKSSDPMWAEAAREILVVGIVSLQQENGAVWTWGDLHARALLGADALKDMALTHHPAAAQMIGDPASKTAMSILTTFKAHIHVLEAMAEAWSAGDQDKFSAANWLTDPHATQPVILQRDGRYPQLTNAWIGGLVSLLSSHVCSPAFGESGERRIGLFLDEFPQLEAMDDLASLLDLGRSKGVCVVLAAQDTSQIRIRYGRDRTNAWLSMIGTHIIGRMNPGEGAEDISRAIGMQEIERDERSKSHSGGNSSVNIATQRSLRPVITPSELSSRLGRKGRKVRMLVLGFGANVHEVNLQITILPPQRPANVPADWTLPDHAPQGTNPATARPASPVQRPQKAGRLSADDIARIRKPKPRRVN